MIRVCEQEKIKNAFLFVHLLSIKAKHNKETLISSSIENSKV